jgi:transposase
VQYGEGVKGFLTYLNQYQLIPYERAAELCEDLFGCAISQGTLLNALKTSYKNLEKTEEAIKEKIIRSDVLHVDESGVYGVEKREWLHTSSTETHTHYHLDSQRGQEGINRGGILCKSQGTAVHDHWEPYKKYSNCAHAYCNAHHLRELTRAYEQDGANWALEMKNLLLKIKESVDEAKENGKKELDVLIRDNFTRGYEAIVEEGLKSYPSEKLENARAPGRKKQCKSKNLLDRLSAHQEETLRFMSDFKVPFDNNLAERDLRMVKVKQKISGCFRSKEGGKYFCRIRGFISTLKKQGKNVLEYLRKAFVPSNGNSNLLQEG